MNFIVRWYSFVIVSGGLLNPRVNHMGIVDDLRKVCAVGRQVTTYWTRDMLNPQVANYI